MLVLGLAWQTVLPTTVVERITMTEEPDGQLEASAAKRIDLWQHAVDVFKSNPTFGIGFGAFGLSIPKGAYEGLTDTHNFYLRMLSEQGILGITSFFIILLAAMRSGWRLYRKGQSEFHRGLGLGFMGCVVAILVTNVFGDRWSYFTLGSYFFVAWGLVDRGITGVDPVVEPAKAQAPIPGSERALAGEGVVARSE